MLIDFPPGVVAETSRRRNQLNWREVNLVRWENNTLRPVKGWEKLNYTGIASPIRAIHKWLDNAGITNVAYLCESHCYVEQGDTFYDVTPIDGISPPSSLIEGGYGDGDYGVGDYGTPRDAVYRYEEATPAFSIANWGQELRVMTSSDGRLLRWDPSTPSVKLEPVDNAPTGNRSFLVTPERHIIIFGENGDRQRFVWSDQENDTNWTPSTTSKAGGFNVEPASPIVAHRLTPHGVVFFTNQASYVVRSVGLPYVYGYEQISECPPPYSFAAVSDTPEGAMWLSQSGFWAYNGVSATPVVCPVWDWVKDKIDDLNTRYTASVVNVSGKGELWFFFASGDAGQRNDFVVIYNYRDNNWSMGHVGRSCGVAYPTDPNPVMAIGSDIYRHEVGAAYPGMDGFPWAETHTFNSGGDGNLTTVHQMLPEVVGDSSAVVFRFVKRNNPSGGSETVSGAKPIRPNGYVDVRETARDIRMRVEQTNSVNWSLGPSDVDVRVRGRK
jgi:hypothetical protein